MAETLSDNKTYEVDIETPDGRARTGRITGKLIAEDSRGEVSAYLTEDERVLIYDVRKSRVHDVTDDPVAAFEDWFRDDEDAYVEAMEAIGERPVVNL